MAKSKKSTGVKKSARRADITGRRSRGCRSPNISTARTFDPSMYAPNANFKLMEELFTYKHHLNELLRDKGKYVLIKGREVVGIYADEQEALREAATRFGYEPALIKQIDVKERIDYLGGAIY